MIKLYVVCDVCGKLGQSAAEGFDVKQALRQRQRARYKWNCSEAKNRDVCWDCVKKKKDGAK